MLLTYAHNNAIVETKIRVQKRGGSIKKKKKMPVYLFRSKDHSFCAG